MKIDVLMATDLRFPGGNNASLVEEVAAQKGAGYATALLHLPSPVQRSERPFADRVRRLLESGDTKLVINEDVRARLLVIRHPTVLMNLSQNLPKLDVDHVVIVANQVPFDGRARAPYYDVLRCDAAAQSVTGKTPLWAPIGPQVRQALAPYTDEIMIKQSDWNNIIDVDAWLVPRSGFTSSPPTIGRHSRGDWSKWPADEQTLTAIYPIDGSYRVKVLGGMEAPKEILGGRPKGWVDLPFNSVPPQEFLKEIDFLVYYHHPGLVEAFGRTLLEGIAAGAVAVTDPVFESTFGDGCVYAEPSEVRDVLDRFSSDFGLYEDQSEKGVQHVRKHFGYESHIRRIEEIIGAPCDANGHVQLSPTRSKESKSRITIVVDLAGEYDEWSGFSTPVVGLTPALQLPSEQSRVYCESIPTALVEDHESLKRYALARVEGLLEVFEGAIVKDVNGRLGTGGLRAASVILRRGNQSSEWCEEAVAPMLADFKKRSFGRLASILRQRAPQWFITAGSVFKNLPRRIRRRAVDALAPHGAILIGSTSFPTSTNLSKAALFVAFDQTLDPDIECKEIIQRGLISSAFRPVLLAPTTWSAAAEKFGIPIETLLSESAVEDLGGRWAEYRRKRIEEAVQVFQPVSVAFVGDNSEVLDSALDIAEVLGSQRSVKES